MRYLQGRGFTLTDDWRWIPPPARNDLTEDEWSAVRYLVWEWDFGGLKY